VIDFDKQLKFAMIYDLINNILKTKRLRTSRFYISTCTFLRLDL